MNNKLNINKTKYRYFMDNLVLFPIKPIMKYTIPVPKGPETKDTEFFDRNYPDVTITNIKMKQMIEKTAKALVAYGVKKGDIVTICQTNTPETFYMDYALNKIGAVANYIYPNVTAEEMKYYIEELDSKYLFILDDDPIRKNVKEATKGTDIKIISSSVIESFPELFKKVASKKMPKNVVELDNEIKWQDFIKNGKKIKEVKETKYVPNSVCSYLHTSGTSNVPKAVMMSNENVNCIPRNYEIDHIKWEANRVAVQTIPQFVSYGITTNHVYFCNNINVVMIAEMEPKNYYDLIHKYKPHYSYTTPSHARELIKRPTDMSNSIMIVFGGDGFDDVEENMNIYIKDNGGNVPAYQGYGSTEMSAVTITNAPGRHKVGSIGKLSGQTRAVIVEPGTKNEITEPGAQGELCLTGPGVTLGYAGNSKEQNTQVFQKHDDGKVYVHMGDLISRDEEGFFYYHGRIKNVITRKSFTFSPEEIVKSIMEHPNVKQCLVIPKYSKEEGETPSAHIVLENYDDMKKTMDEIIELVESNVQLFHWPTDYKIRSEIPRTRNNKNNVTALKIEDAACMHEGVVCATIKSINDGEFEYSMDVEINSNIVERNENFVEILDKHIKTIANFTKFNVGKIKYNIKSIDINYVDSDKILEKNQSYVKHI